MANMRIDIKEVLMSEGFRKILSGLVFLFALALLLMAIGVDELVVCKLETPVTGIDIGVFTFHSGLLTDGKRDMLSHYKFEYSVSYEGCARTLTGQKDLPAMGGSLPKYAMASYFLLMASAFLFYFMLIAHLKWETNEDNRAKKIIFAVLTLAVILAGAIMATLPVTMSTPTEMNFKMQEPVLGVTDCQMGLTGIFAWVSFSLWAILMIPMVISMCLMKE